MSASARLPICPSTGNCTSMFDATTTSAIAATNGKYAEKRGIFLSWVMEPVGRLPEAAKSGRLFGGLLGDLLLQEPGALRQFRRIGLGEKGVEAAAMLDRAQRIGRNAQAHILVQRLGDQRHLDQVGQELALGLVVGVA